LNIDAENECAIYTESTEEERPLVTVTMWLFIHLTIDLIAIARECLIAAVFKFAEDPKKAEIFISLFQILVIWNLYAIWGIYGLSFMNSSEIQECSDNSETFFN
jgi:hypothetical membrane protein